MFDLKELYNEHWGRNYGDTEEKETPEFWSKMSKLFTQKAHNTEARKDTESFIKKFNWDKNETVLDIAAGPGTYAIPLSKYVKEITATDFSTEMLNELKKQADKEHRYNIKTICGRWLDLQFTKNEKYNTVLCLNCLGVITCDNNHESHLIETLKKINNIALDRVIILIPHADSALDNKMRYILKIKELPVERQRIATLYFAMVECGMLPSLEIIQRPFRWIFTSTDEAIEKIIEKSGQKSIDKTALNELKEYLSTILIKKENNTLFLSYKTKQALFTYIKK